MPIEIVEPRRLYRQVADQLRALMDSGEFPVGARLPTERELALQLGVSRPTVREALIALEVDGRVKIRVGSGIYVLAPPAERRPEPAAIAGPFEILGARALFEGAVAEAAAKVARPHHIAGLDRILAAMRAAAHPGTDSLAVDRSFHVAIADILGNDAITEIVGMLFDQRINPYFAQLARYFETPDSWQATLVEHERIRDALASGDGAAAAAAMRAHLAASQERFSKSFAAPEAGSVPAGPAEKVASRRARKSGDDRALPKTNRRKLS